MAEVTDKDEIKRLMADYDERVGKLRKVMDELNLTAMGSVDDESVNIIDSRTLSGGVWLMGYPPTWED